MYVKLGWLDIHFLDHEVIVEIDSANRIPAFNLFEEKDDVEQRYNNFRIIDLIREEFISLGTDYTLIMRMTFKAYNFMTSGVMKKVLLTFYFLHQLYPIKNNLSPCMFSNNSSSISQLCCGEQTI